MLKTSNFFDSFCKNAKHNAILVMDTKGVILEVNKAFLTAFGYVNEDLIERNFNILFTEEDRKKNKPEIELQKANNEGSGSDDNYLLQKSGKQVWVNGESVLVTGDDEVSYIIKIIHNIEAQKQLERFLLESNDFIETILESITDRGLIILDAEMKVIKVNSKFVEMFNLKEQPPEESKVSNIQHPFWSSPDVKQLLRNVLVRNEAIQNKGMEYTDDEGKIKWIELSSKFLQTHNVDKRILLAITPVAD